MIIDQIKLCNFGVYQGTHIIDLRPKSINQPIILVIALNGSGKTTLLDAMQLALYGKLGTYASRRDGTYENFLKTSMNRSAGENSESSIELTFREIKDGSEKKFQINRSWFIKDTKVRESFDVLCDDVHDSFLSENWYEYVEEILPSRIAPLFFFDGEKIVELADIEKAPIILKVAIQSLLGLDIVQQLKIDLEVLIRRKQIDSTNDKDREYIEMQQAKLIELEKQFELIFQEKANAQTDYDILNLKLDEAKRRFSEYGGDLYNKRSEIEKQFEILNEIKNNHEKKLREISAGVLPLAILKNQLNNLREIEENDRILTENKSIINALKNRDIWLIENLEKMKLNDNLIREIRKILSENIISRENSCSKNPVLDLKNEARDTLKLAINTIANESESASREVTNFKETKIKITELERKLSAIPSSSSIQNLLDTIENTNFKREIASSKLNEISKKLSDLEVSISKTKKELMRSLESEVFDYQNHSDSARIIEHSKKALITLQNFEAQVIDRHIKRLENLVLEALHTLLRKKLLISNISINSDDFSIQLIGNDGRYISFEKLSAGERQLLAVSLLWGLAKASGRNVPTIIDTPLGRLDSAHRENIVEKYFPIAGKQVILLSTDTEITNDHYKTLKPFISYSYTLSNDGGQNGTVIYNGVEGSVRGAA